MNISTYKKKSFGKIKLFRQIYTHHQKNPPPQKKRGHFLSVVKRTYKPHKHCWYSMVKDFLLRSGL